MTFARMTAPQNIGFLKYLEVRFGYAGKTVRKVVCMYVLGCCEGCVERLGLLHIVNALYLVEVERVLSPDGTVETCLQKGRPVLLEHELATDVVLAYASHSGVDHLHTKIIPEVHEIWRYMVQEQSTS